jgi:hypothetical protein
VGVSLDLDVRAHGFPPAGGHENYPLWPRELPGVFIRLAGVARCVRW